MKIVSDIAFYWFVVGMIAAIAVGWFSFDLYRLKNELALGDEKNSDRLFGIFIGLVLSGMGGVGLIYHFFIR